MAAVMLFSMLLMSKVKKGEYPVDNWAALDASYHIQRHILVLILSIDNDPQLRNQTIRAGGLLKQTSQQVIDLNMDCK